MKPIINIRFDANALGVYYSGQVVSGKVEITFSQTKKVRGIVLKLVGSAATRFNGRSSTRRRRGRRAHYSGKEVYLSSSQYLYGSASETATDMAPGTYVYYFSCQLSPEVPSSFESRYGHIRYLAKVVLDRPWKFDQTYTEGFTVLKALDLNYESPNLRLPCEIQTTKSHWLGLFGVSPLNIRATIPQTGFVPGQVIPVCATIDNASKIPIRRISIYLSQLVFYYADFPTIGSKEYELGLVRKRIDVGKLGQATLTLNEILKIPALPPSSAHHSRIIKVSYEVRVELVISRWHTRPCVRIPIVIGTVPLLSMLQQHVPVQTTMGPMPISITAMPSTSVEDPDVVANIPPPSYEEAVLIDLATEQVDDSEQDSLEGNKFLPRYPVYNTLPMIAENSYAAEDTKKEKLVP